MSLHIDYHAVLVAVEQHQDSCPLCATLRSGETSFWDSVLFSQVGTEGFQDEFLATDGFCARHVSDFVSRHDGTAATMLYAPLLRHRSAWIRDEARPAARLRRMLRRVGSGRSRTATPAERGRRATRSDCVLCEREAHWARRFAINLLRHQHDQRLRSALSGGRGFCLQHLRAVVREGGRRGVPRIAPWLLDHHQRIWDAAATRAEADVHGSGGMNWKVLLVAQEGSAAVHGDASDTPWDR